MLPEHLKLIALFLQRLPGIGEKSANRLALYLLRMPQADLEEFGRNVAELKEKTKRCSVCCNLSEQDVCVICNDPRKDARIITVVETPLDVLSFQTGGIYNGLYHVLHGRIDPLNNVGPDDIFIEQLIKRVEKAEKGAISEIILATNPDMEGEATAGYIKKKLQELEQSEGILITRLAYGLPMGASVEYADYGTLGKAMENRKAL